jgi:DNA-binding NarL/FixJ family response regulator
MQIVLQERQRLFREGMAIFLTRDAGVDVIAAVENPEDVVQFCSTATPDVVVLEADIPGFDVVDLRRTLQRVNPTVRVVGVCSSTSRAVLLRLSAAGLDGVVSRGAGVLGLSAAVRATESKRASVADHPGVRREQGTLTPRELRVLELVSSGRTTGEIAGVLDISRKTVENHKQRIFAKFDVQNQAHAVSVALRRGVLFPISQPIGA